MHTHRDINILEDLDKELFGSEGFLDFKAAQRVSAGRKQEDAENIVSYTICYVLITNFH